MMETKALQCDICGGELEIVSGGQSAICKSCGMPHSIERVREKVQEVRGKVSVEGPVMVSGIKTKTDLLKNAETFIELKEYEKAKDIYQKLMDEYPEEPDGWWGMYKMGFTYFEGFHYLVQNEKYAKTAMKLRDYTYEYKELWDSFLGDYGNDIHINEESDIPWNRIDTRDIELMLFKEENLQGLPLLIQLRSNILKSYCRMFEEGKVSFFANRDFYEFWSCDYRASYYRYNDGKSFAYEECLLKDYPVLMSIRQKGYENAQKINEDNEFFDVSLLLEHITYVSAANSIYGWENCLREDCDCSNYILNHSNGDFEKSLYNIVFYYGNTMIVKTVDEFNQYYNYIIILDSVYDINEIKEKLQGIKVTDKKEVYLYRTNKEVFYKKKGLCSFCGGKLKQGFFGSKCVSCGRKKAY